MVRVLDSVTVQSGPVVKPGPNRTWSARLDLDFHKGPRKTFVHRSHSGPLSMQRAFYPEGDVCHVTLLHPPGGVVSGDELSVSVDVKPGARALVVTPGATKHYRSRADESGQNIDTQTLGVVKQSLNVDGGSLEWLPNESIHFDGSETQVETRIQLRGDARVIALDVQVFGRLAGGLPFNQGQANVGLSVFDEGVPVLLDRLKVKGVLGLDNAAGLRSYTVYGTLIATHASDDLIELVRQAVVPKPKPEPISQSQSQSQSRVKADQSQSQSQSQNYNQHYNQSIGQQLNHQMMRFSRATLR